MLQIGHHVLLPVIASNGDGNFIKIAKKTYEKMGITILGKHDGIFQWVELPDYWTIMVDADGDYDILLDDADNIRGTIYNERNVEGGVTYAIFKEVK